MASVAIPEEIIQSDIVIIGSGVVGCAVAAILSREFKNKTIIILESGPRIGEGTTSRNSGVIHAGIYYPPNSLKAQLCIEGNERLYFWAEKFHLPYKKIGKVIVAKGEAQETILLKTFNNARDSGAKNLRLISRDELLSLEPHLDMDSAIYSPETGIIDQYEFTRSLANVSENNGVIFSFNSEVKSIEKNQNGYLLETIEGHIQTPVVINSAGLHADDIARMVGIDRYRIYPCRGDYFSFRPKVKFNHLIYPVKEPGAPGLGVHLTVDTGGTYRLGPDTEYVLAKSDFEPAEGKLEKFRESASKLLGEGNVTDLRYDFCGIRPKLRSPQEKEEKDFVISQDLPGFVNLVGIESPGLTSSLAIAERIRNLI